jgi:hypothetical protein
MATMTLPCWPPESAMAPAPAIRRELRAPLLIVSRNVIW